MLFHTFQHTIPAAYALLPTRMQSPSATAMLLAIGLQESKFEHRRQVRGPAHGFWQFERGGGVRGVMEHAATKEHIISIFRALAYPSVLTTQQAYDAIVHNDVLACVFARLLLWTLPAALPVASASGIGWDQYLNAWRPGKPHSETWPNNYRLAWDLVQP